MRIGSSIFPQRSLYSTSRAIERSLERLSSGSRITSAADDVAGLQTSVTLTSRVRGIQMALRNITDSSGILQVADGSLQQATNILQQIRELAMQAANGTLSSDERVSIHDQADTLLEEYEQLIHQTDFNGIKLLDGTFGTKIIQVGPENNDVMPIALADMRSNQIGTLQEAGRTFSQTFYTGETGISPTVMKIDMANDSIGYMFVTNGTGDGEVYRTTDGGESFSLMSSISLGGMTQNGFAVVDSETVIITGVNGAIKRSQDGGETFTEVGTTSGANGDDDFEAADFNKNGIGIAAGLNGKVWRSTDTGLTWSEVTFAGSCIADVQIRDDGVAFLTTYDGPAIWRSSDAGESFTQVATPAEGVTAIHVNDSGCGFTSSGTTIYKTSDDGITWTEGATLGDISVDIYTVDSQTAYAVTAGGLYKTTDGGATFTCVSSSGANGSAVQVLSNRREVVYGETDGTGGYIQKNSDSGLVALDNYGNNTLSGMDLSTAYNAGFVLERVDQAIRDITSAQAQIGSYHNVLEHRVNALLAEEANTADALSTIRDVDFALETAELVRNQIIEQAGIAVLGQANVMQSQVLALLKY